MSARKSEYTKKELEDARNMARDLWDLEFQAEANEDNPDFDEQREMIYLYDVAFGVSKLAMLEYIEFETLPDKTLDEIVVAWTRLSSEGFF